MVGKEGDCMHATKPTAGTMHGFDFTKPDQVDVETMQADVHTNLVAPMALVKR